MMSRKRLTQRQETFCLKYFELGNATEAALIAGYSPKTVRKIASVNLTKGNIQTRLQELRQAAEDASIASVLERKQVLSSIVRATPKDVMEIEEGERDTKIKPEALDSPAVSYIRTEQISIGKMPVRVTRVGMMDKVRAISELNKMENIYSDQPPINIDNRQINFIVRSKDEADEVKRLISGISNRDNGHQAD